MNFLQSIEVCFNKFADFNGRATRPEYWWFTLFYILCYIVAFAIDPVIEVLVWFGLLIPGLAVGARRLHDINKSGWLQLISLIPLVGTIILIVWFATEGEKRKNQYGKPPVKIKRRR